MNSALFPALDGGPLTTLGSNGKSVHAETQGETVHKNRPKRKPQGPRGKNEAGSS